MSDPGTTYRTRDEVQAMRAEKDTIAGLKKNILDWGVADEATLKVSHLLRGTPRQLLIYKAIVDGAKVEIDAAVEEAKQSPFPDLKEFWTDIYYKGTEPPFMRGREKEEVHYYNKEASA
jgi:pyruvate dehydrogenase E1 component alpha subunit